MEEQPVDYQKRKVITMENQEQEQLVETSVPTENVGVGESEQEQEQTPPVPQYSTVARERFVEIIANNKKVIADAEKMMDLINADPSLDDSMCRLFGIQSGPTVRG